MNKWIFSYCIVVSTDVIQLTLTLKMTTAQVVETSVTVNNNSPVQDYVHLDYQTHPTLENFIVTQNKLVSQLHYDWGEFSVRFFFDNL